MTRRTIDHSGRDVPKRLTKEQKELRSLQARWLAADGHEMPLNIQCLSIEVIDRAVRKREAGETVFVETDSPVSVTRKSDESLLEWDGSSND